MTKISFKPSVVFFDFDGVFTDNFVYVNEFGHETVKCYRSDGIGLSLLRDINVKAVIVSTEKNNVVKIRGSKLKLEVFNGIENKAEFITQFCNKNNYRLNESIFVGNDINDLEAMKLVGFPIAVCDAFDSVKIISKYVTKLNGGCGAVREICELIYNNFYE
jgi:3-deoxy-D-manno-octulosonate 8-phosphate phosphatase (KDO 8-P phosphatase)